MINKKREKKLNEKGMFVQISDCKLYAKLVGENKGRPTIVMDAGYGNTSKNWDSVINDISMLSDVFIYDRAGWSLKISRR
ncbi:hypothetical protein GCM10011384_43110 [Psychrobacillus lasiicapitis]|nr:hypothetical protein [Psychrobacillus lasiicapitis]GGA48794.1 hypothetical protein GCM10011384_43110 [Psychrobacillus lasiicapitis]